MHQLTLPMLTRLAYAPEHFVLHAGVKQLFEECLAAVYSERFRSLFVVGQSRSGKTHLAVKLVDQLCRVLGADTRSAASAEDAETRAAPSIMPQLVEGRDFGAYIAQSKVRAITIVDDAHEYFAQLRASDSGAFVNFIETQRSAGGKVIMLSRQAYPEFTHLDGHVLSRLREAAGSLIGPPSEADLPELLSRIAEQRGVRLRARSMQLIVKRVGRDIAALESNIERLLHLSQLLGRSIKMPLIADAVAG